MNEHTSMTASEWTNWGPQFVHSPAVVVILFPEEYTKHMHNIMTIISQNVFLWWLPEKLRDSSSWQPMSLTCVHSSRHSFWMQFSNSEFSCVFDTQSHKKIQYYFHLPYCCWCKLSLLFLNVYLPSHCKADNSGKTLCMKSNCYNWHYVVCGLA